MASGGETAAVKDILEDEQHFPPFQELCVENSFDPRYWKKDLVTGRWVYACTWCFMAQITFDKESQLSFERNNIRVRDRSWEDHIPILFYPKCGSFDFKTLKNGHTICVVQAQKHHFLNQSIGLRVENLDTVKVIPCSLYDLISLSTFYSKYHNVCWGCKKKKGDTTAGKLKRCGACHTAYYCSRDCQLKDWKGCHQRWCKVIPEFLKLTKIDYTKYDKHALPI